MHSPDSATFTPRQALVSIRIIWLAMLMGLLFFLVVVAVMLIGQTGPAKSGDPVGMYVFYVAVAGLLTLVPLGYFIRSQTYKRHWQGDVVTPAGYFGANVVLLAMIEGVAFLGLVAVLLHGAFFPVVLPSIGALAIMVVNYPTGAAMHPDPAAPTPLIKREHQQTLP